MNKALTKYRKIKDLDHFQGLRLKDVFLLENNFEDEIEKGINIEKKFRAYERTLRRKPLKEKLVLKKEVKHIPTEAEKWDTKYLIKLNESHQYSYRNFKKI